MCQAVSELVSRKIGPLNQLRWLTTANKIPRLYDPSNNIKNLVTCWLTPTWLAIMQRWSKISGETGNLSFSLKKIVDHVIERNSSLITPTENVILAMITDERPHEYNNISYICNQSSILQVPPFIATEYNEMVDWRT